MGDQVMYKLGLTERSSVLMMRHDGHMLPSLCPQRRSWTWVQSLGLAVGGGATWWTLARGDVGAAAPSQQEAWDGHSALCFPLPQFLSPVV